MEISFIKKKEDGHVISCKRFDGTITWMHSSKFFVLHDICHYSVETKLRFKKAFYGMLASGISISDFELPKHQRPFELTEEAIVAEHIVNLLGIDYSRGNIDDFKEQLMSSFNGDIHLFAGLSEEILKEIRSDIRMLMNNWNQLNEEESLTLVFEE